MADSSKTDGAWSPESLIVKYVEGVALTLIAICLALLLFPFSWSRLVLVVMAVLFAALLRFYGKLARRKRPIWYSYAVLIAVLVAGTALPLYGANRFVLLSPSNKPWESRFVDLAAFQGEQQSILIESHPVRKWLALLLLADSDRLVRTETFAGAVFCVPSAYGIITVRESEHVVSTTVPYVINGSRIEFGPGALDIADNPLGMGRLFTMTYMDWPGNPPWQSVHVPDDSALEDAAVYSVWLHRLLSSLCDNDPETCFAAATKMVESAPSSMEAARAYALRSALAEVVLIGNVGRHQRLIDGERALAAYGGVSATPGGVPDWYPTRGFVHAHLRDLYGGYGDVFKENVSSLGESVPPEVPLFRRSPQRDSVLEGQFAPMTRILAHWKAAVEGQDLDDALEDLIIRRRQPSFFRSFRSEWNTRPVEELVEFLDTTDELAPDQLQYARIELVTRVFVTMLAEWQQALFGSQGVEPVDEFRAAVARAAADLDRYGRMDPYCERIATDAIPLLDRLAGMLSSAAVPGDGGEDQSLSDGARRAKALFQIDDRFPAMSHLLNTLESGTVTIVASQPVGPWWTDEERVRFLKLAIDVFLAERRDWFEPSLVVNDPDGVLGELRSGNLGRLGYDATGEVFVPGVLMAHLLFEESKPASEKVVQILAEQLAVDADQLLNTSSLD